MGYFRLVRHRAARERISGQTARFTVFQNAKPGQLRAERAQIFGGPSQGLHRDGLVKTSARGQRGVRPTPL